mgnify:CR=1 FL=1
MRLPVHVANRDWAFVSVYEPCGGVGAPVTMPSRTNEPVATLPCSPWTNESSLQPSARAYPAMESDVRSRSGFRRPDAPIS